MKKKKEKTKVIALFLQYDTEKYPCALHYFKKYLNGLTDTEIQLITVDNKLDSDYFEQVADKEIIINGDNSLWEFSGWQKGLKYIYDNKIDYDVIIFANDSFLAPAGGGTDLSGLINDESIKTAKGNSMVGQFCSIDEGITINGVYIYNYARTHCFLLSKEIIERIKCLPTVDCSFLNKCIPDIDNIDNKDKIKGRMQFLTGKCDYSLYFKDDAPLSKNFQRFIITHLTKHWHSKVDIFDNWELFRGKMLSYLNEMLLTAKVRELIRVV